VDARDHCETAERAYEDISLVLERVAKVLGKTKDSVKIYDPFYCEGRVAQIIKSLGFPNIHNKCEDFYKVVKENALPEYDILVTNPPYSGDNMKKCF